MVALTASISPGDEKKAEKAAVPEILVAVPFTLKLGSTQTNKLRGLNLTNVTELRLGNNTNGAISATIRKQSATKAPPNTDAAKVGDTELEVSFTVPNSVSSTQTEITAVSTNGTSKPFAMMLVAPERVTEEIEPNNSFRTPQSISIPATIQGTIREPHDVDVFRFEGKKGEVIRCKTTASSMYSPLDSLLTLYDSKGHIIKSSDDSEGTRDPELKATLPENESYFLSITDAQDRGSVLHCYICVIE
jgi:hypothetical protein